MFVHVSAGYVARAYVLATIEDVEQALTGLVTGLVEPVTGLVEQGLHTRHQSWPEPSISVHT